MAMKKMYFLIFLVSLSCFQLIHVCLCHFSCFFGCLIRVLEVSPFAGGLSVLLIASHVVRSVQEGEEVEVSGMLMTQAHFSILFGSYNIFLFFSHAHVFYFFLGC